MCSLQVQSLKVDEDMLPRADMECASPSTPEAMETSIRMWSYSAIPPARDMVLHSSTVLIVPTFRFDVHLIGGFVSIEVLVHNSFWEFICKCINSECSVY